MKTIKKQMENDVLERHKRTMEYLSMMSLWKIEFSFFQKLLDAYAPKMLTLEDRKKIDHFQSIITYYSGELLGKTNQQLRLHEEHLARLEKTDQSKLEYQKQDEMLVAEVDALERQIQEHKTELFAFIEKVL